MPRPARALAGAALAAAALVIALAVASNGSARPALWVAPSAAKVRPEDDPPGRWPFRGRAPDLARLARDKSDVWRPSNRPGDSPAIRLRALRGECEVAHLALSAGDKPIEGVRAHVAEAPGDRIVVRLYREVLVDLPKPSGPDGHAGRWPDPLVPAVDALHGEARRAFPFTVPAGETRAILVEACVDATTSPGFHRGRISLTAGSLSGPVPLEVRVEAAVLPATAGLPTTFGFSALRAALAHYGRPGTDDELHALDRAYRTVLLAHRISAHGGTMAPPPFRRWPAGIEVDFRDYDREVGAFLDGTALPSGARATTVELRTHPALATDEERVAYWRAIARHHREKGWNAILFDYAKDEPERGDLPAVAARARLVHRADPTIRVLLTASLDPSLAGLVDLWVPNLNCLFTRRRPDEYCKWREPRSAYRDPWWYVSCSSHGCGEGPKSDYFSGWAGYAIDLPGARARAMGWLAFREGVGGELYWDTVYGYGPDGRPRDVWNGDGLRAFGGNGDGTLLYPGTPARIGGSTQLPVESLRLKAIRDGIEDHDLLRLVAAVPGGKEAIHRELESLAPTPWSIEPDAAAWEAARGRLLDLLAAKSARTAPRPGE